MKTKKTLTNLAAVLALCAILVFNFAVYPSVLASAPEESEIKIVTMESTPLLTTPEESAESEVQPNINAISKKQAIDNALGRLKKTQYADDVHERPVAVKYVDGIAPSNNPVWVVVFKSDHDIMYQVTPEQYASDKYKREKLETDDQGNRFMRVSGINLHIVEVNAFTGEADYNTEIGSNDNEGSQKKEVWNWLFDKYGYADFEFDE